VRPCQRRPLTLDGAEALAVQDALRLAGTGRRLCVCSVVWRAGCGWPVVIPFLLRRTSRASHMQLAAVTFAWHPWHPWGS
jgi:hypothetical protein